MPDDFLARIAYRVEFRRWSRCGAIQGALLRAALAAAYALVPAVRQDVASYRHGPALFWGMSMFWALAWPWILTALHRPFARKALEHILRDELEKRPDSFRRLGPRDRAPPRRGAPLESSGWLHAVPRGKTLRWRCASIGFLTAMLGFSGPTDAGPGGGSTQVPPSVVKYAMVLDRALGSRNVAPIESLYGFGTQAAESLLVVRTPGGSSLLESFDDATFTEVQRRMRGFTLWRDEVVVATPDPHFFLTLARSRGDAVDTAFFHALTLTYGQGASPIYVEMQTDYSGCTDFGSGKLVATFAAWNEFSVKHARRYGAWSGEELHKIEEELATGTCACGDRESVIRELREFARRFPSAAVTPRVRARLRAIEAGTSEIRYHCTSG